jgi:rubredoxin
MFDIILVLAIIGAFGFPIWIGYQIRGWRGKEVKEGSGRLHTGRPFGETKLDPKYAHVQAHVFWPVYHSIPLLSRWLGYTHDIITENDLPKVRYVINYRTKNAFNMGDHAYGLLVPLRLIEINSETKWFPFYADLWLRRHGFHWTGRAATPADLLEKSDLSESTGLSPLRLEIANCLNCGSKWVVEPLNPLQEAILRVGTMSHDKDLPRTVLCPKCGMPAQVTKPKNREEN